jgi:hypothetical protein
VFFAVTAVTCGLSLILTHNRAGLLGGLLGSGLVVLRLARSPVKFVRATVWASALLVLLGWLLVTFLPDQFNAYRTLLNVGAEPSSGGFLADSDKLRLVFVKRTLESLWSNPVGNGYTMLTGVPGFTRIDPHNMLAQIVWAAGWFGVGWLLYFGRHLVRQTGVLFSKQQPRDALGQYGIAVFGGLLGWFLCGMAHTIIGTGVSWLLFGVLLRIVSGLRYRDVLKSQ